MPISNVFCIDCMEYMKGLPDQAFDLALCDPPYFSGPEHRGFYGKRISSIGVTRTYLKTSTWEVPHEDFFLEVERVCKKYIIWGCNYFDYVFSPGRIVWDKCNGNSSFSDCEIAATNIINSVRLFRYMWSGMMQGKSASEGHIMQGNKRLNEKRIHPTQKPVALYHWLLRSFAQPGAKILDTHLGSGSSRISAYKMGFDFYACEKNKQYYDLQEKRFKKECLGYEEMSNGRIYIQKSLFN